ncbi:unannotated protein [freshwater metagenome]|uniref:Unannotated protein n=1 Tax=freshwater metagenome TaxID=449393 RepID=A0A6J7RKA1_9ZZZZ
MPLPEPTAVKANACEVSTTTGPSAPVIEADTTGVPPEPITTVTKSDDFRPRESVASTRSCTVTFAAGAVKLNAAVFVVAAAITDGVGPDACDQE